MQHSTAPAATYTLRDALEGRSPAADWAPRLRALQRTWPLLLASTDPRAERAIRHRLAHAVAFASQSIHTNVGPHERYYMAIRRGVTRAMARDDVAYVPPRGANPLPVAQSALEHGIAWTKAVDIDTLRDAHAAGTLAEVIMASVRGLGPAKATFAAALCGDPEAACIDTHGLVDVLGLSFEEAERRRKQWRRANGRGYALYRQDVATAFGRQDAAFNQWQAFADIVPAFRRSGHLVYFESVGL